MPINITMPALSPTMEEGNLAKWLVKEGDSVSAGDVIAEIETDKATMEVEAVDEGTVGKILVAEGTAGVKVNELIAVLLEDGEDASAIGSAPAAAPAAGSDSGPARLRQHRLECAVIQHRRQLRRPDPARLQRRGRGTHLLLAPGTAPCQSERP
jgi:pyruvate/2-oxoglutarate dehydrogenase complex dihydrolipoamide acyltransferase (E2) component